MSKRERLGKTLVALEVGGVAGVVTYAGMELASKGTFLGVDPKTIGPAVNAYIDRKAQAVSNIGKLSLENPTPSAVPSLTATSTQTESPTFTPSPSPTATLTSIPVEGMNNISTPISSSPSDFLRAKGTISWVDYLAARRHAGELNTVVPEMLNMTPSATSDRTIFVSTATATLANNTDRGFVSSPTPDRRINFDLISTVKAGNENIPNSVVMGGIQTGNGDLDDSEAVRASFVINGTSSGNQNFNDACLNEARSYMVYEGLPADFRVDIPTLKKANINEGELVATINGVDFISEGNVFAEGVNGEYSYKLFKANANVKHWKQVAMNTTSCEAYPSSGTLRDQELAFVFVISDSNGNVINKTAIRGKCGNFMSENLVETTTEDRPTPVDTSTAYPSATSTLRFGETPSTPTPVTPTETRVTRTPTEVIVTTVRPTETFVPTNTHHVVPTETQNPPTETDVFIVETATSVPTNHHLPTEVATEVPPLPTETGVPIGINTETGVSQLVKYFLNPQLDQTVTTLGFRGGESHNLKNGEQHATLATNPIFAIGMIALTALNSPRVKSFIKRFRK